MATGQLGNLPVATMNELAVGGRVEPGGDDGALLGAKGLGTDMVPVSREVSDDKTEANGQLQQVAGDTYKLLQRRRGESKGSELGMRQTTSTMPNTRSMAP